MAKQLATKNDSVVLYEERSLFIPPKEVEERLDAINTMAAIIQKKLKKDHDFGVIPGTQKPTLLKPGAEKMTKILNLADVYEIIEKTLNWEKPFFYFEVKCSLVSLISGQVVSEGLGSCNSLEDRYRWRWVFKNELPKKNLDDKGNPFPEVEFRQRFSEKTQKYYTQYRIENDNIYTLVNTLMKIAEKRALVDAALHAGRLSDLFTQDVEDIYGEYKEEKTKEEKAEKPESPPKQKAKPKKEEAKEAEVVKEEKPEKKEEAKPEEETREAPVQDEAITEEQAREFFSVFNTLVDKYGRDVSDLSEKIHDKLKSTFKTIRKKIPDDLTFKEAKTIIGCLNLSLKKEQQKDAEIEEEAQAEEI